VTDELKKEIQTVISENELEKVFAVKRESYIFGKRFRFSGMQDDYPIRLFPNGKARYEQPVHEILVTNLPLYRLKNHLTHYSTKDNRHYFSKMKQYVELEVKTMIDQKRSAAAWDVLARPVYRFIYRYFLKLGFLDGLAGLKFAWFSGYYDFLKYRNYRQQLAGKN